MDLEFKRTEVMRRSEAARDTLQSILELFNGIKSDDVSHILMICLADIAKAFMHDVAQLTRKTKTTIRGDTLLALMINNLDGYSSHLLEQLQDADKPRH